MLGVPWVLVSGATLPWAVAIARLAPTLAWSYYMRLRRNEGCSSGDGNVHAHSQLGAGADGVSIVGVLVYGACAVRCAAPPPTTCIVDDPWPVWEQPFRRARQPSYVYDTAGPRPGQPLLGGRSSILACLLFGCWSPADGEHRRPGLSLRLRTRVTDWSALGLGRLTGTRGVLVLHGAAHDDLMGVGAH